MDQNSTGNIPLADMVEALRQELYDAIHRSQGQDLAFGVDKVELELKVEVQQSKQGKGEVKFWVVAAGGEIADRRTQTHTFKLTLQPVYQGGKTRISSSVDERPR
jgi:hypothetical protein